MIYVICSSERFCAIRGCARASFDGVIFSLPMNFKVSDLFWFNVNALIQGVLNFFELSNWFLINLHDALPPKKGPSFWYRVLPYNTVFLRFLRGIQSVMRKNWAGCKNSTSHEPQKALIYKSYRAHVEIAIHPWVKGTPRWWIDTDRFRKGGKNDEKNVSIAEK